MGNASSPSVEKVLRDELSDKLYEHIVNYYSAMLGELTEKSKLLFLSRRGYELFKLLWENNLLRNTQFVDNALFSDRLIEKLTVQERKDYLSDCDLLIIADDTIVKGHGIGRIIDEVASVPNLNCLVAAPIIYEDFDCYKARNNWKAKVRNASEIEIFEPVCFEISEISSFSTKFIDVAHKLGLCYTMDLPCYNLDFKGAVSEIDVALARLSDKWECTPLYIERINGEGNFSNQYVLTPKQPIFTGGAWFYEGIRFFYTEDAVQDENGLLQIKFVPSVLFSAIHLNKAVQFIRNIVDRGSAIEQRLESMDFKKEATEDIKYIHKLMVFFLTAAIGKQFTEDIRDGAIDFCILKRHMHEPLIRSIEVEYEKIDFVARVKSAFEKAGLSCEPEPDENAIIKAYNQKGIRDSNNDLPEGVEAYDLLVKLTKPSFEQYEDMFSAFKESAHIIKWECALNGIPIWFWLSKCKNISPKERGLLITIVTGCSISSFSAICDQGLLVKMAMPGEGSIVALRKPAEPVACAAVQYLSNVKGYDYRKYFYLDTFEWLRKALRTFFNNYTDYEHSKIINPFLWRDNVHKTLSTVWGNKEFSVDELNEKQRKIGDLAEKFTMVYSILSAELRPLPPEEAAYIIAQILDVELQPSAGSDQKRKEISALYNELSNDIHNWEDLKPLERIEILLEKWSATRS
jgi:hypothetical protein